MVLLLCPTDEVWAVSNDINYSTAITKGKLGTTLNMPWGQAVECRLQWQQMSVNSRASRLLVRQFLQGNVKAPHHWPFCEGNPPTTSGFPPQRASLALCEGNPPATGGFPSQRASDAESVSNGDYCSKYPYDNESGRYSASPTVMYSVPVTAAARWRSLSFQNERTVYIGSLLNWHPPNLPLNLTALSLTAVWTDSSHDSSQPLRGRN